MSHLFLDRVFEYELRKPESMPDIYTYNANVGYWTDVNGSPCVLDSEFSKPMTKKEDRETGEDQKGE